METNEGPPMEERDFPEGSSFTKEEHEEENRDFLEFLDESKYGLNKRDYLDFVDNIRELRNNEYLQERSDKYTYLPNTQSIRFKTIEVLKKMREESYPNIENNYRENDIEKKKIDDNRDKYVEHKSKNKDVRIFIDFSKTIEELEKEIYSENSMHAMYVFADYEEEPRSKKLREKLIEFFKDRRNTYLFFIGGTVVIALSAVVVTIEESLRNLKNEVEKKMYKKYLEIKDEIKNEVDKTKDEVGDSIKDEVDKTKGEIKDSIKDEVNKTKGEVKDSIKDEIGKTREEIKNLIKDEVRDKASKIKKDVSISQKKVEYTLLSLLNDILYKVLEYIFVILIFCIVYFLYYKYGRTT